MRLVTTILLSILLFSGGYLHATNKDDKKKSATELGEVSGGIVYALPRTGIRIMIETSQEKFFRGPYSDFALKYLGVTDAASSDSELWKITDVKMETFGEPDPDEIHKAKGAIASMVSLTEDGVLAGINSEIKEADLKNHTSVFTADVEVPRSVWTERSMHSFFEGKDSTHRAGNTLKSAEEKAAEAAHDIFKLRKRKALALAAGYDKLPPDGQAYQVMVDQLNKIIGDYEALFVGKSYTAVHKYVFEIVPDANDNKALLAFRFSSSAGILPESNVSGKPVILEIDANSDIVRNSQQIAGNAEGANASGLYYRAPARVVARLLNGADVLAQARLSLGQYGVTIPVPDGLLNGDYSIEFHPATGAILRVGN